MKRKMILFAALVAASSTAFVACSSSDDDVLPQAPVAPAAEETVVEETEGTPLTIKVVDATRGTDYTASTLNKLYLYSTKNGATGVDNRWLGSYIKGESIPEELTKDGEGKLVTSGLITWKSYTEDVEPGYDFYAFSDATFAREDDGQSGDQAAEHLDASPRTFSYTVTNAYGDQQDLLVGSTLNQKSTTNTINPGQVNLNLYHALARIKSVKLCYHASETNTGMFFIIKSMTLKNVASTGTFTFPNDENLVIDRTASPKVDNVTSAWSGQTGLKDYTFTFPDFETDINGNIWVFDETPNSTSVYENEIKCLHADTKRGGISGFPNFFTVPEKDVLVEWEFPLEVNVDNTTDPVTYTKADNKGLFLLPQTLAKTVATSDADDKWTFNPNSENTPYLEIRFYGLNVSYDSSDDEFYSVTDFCGADGVTEMYPNASLTEAIGNHALITNARIDYALKNDYLYTVAIPLSQIVLEGGKYYTLKAYLNLATDIYSTDALRIFEGSTVSSD